MRSSNIELLSDDDSGRIRYSLKGPFGYLMTCPETPRSTHVRPRNDITYDSFFASIRFVTLFEVMRSLDNKSLHPLMQAKNPLRFKYLH